jgi:hypothetical protein
MLHDGTLSGVDVFGTGLDGLAFAASFDRKDIERLHSQGLCEPPHKGGTMAWVGALTPVGLENVVTA